MDRVLEVLEPFRDAVPREDVRMSGAWARPQRRQASAEHLAPVDWQWDGTFEAASALAGIAFLSHEADLYWAKSQPPDVRTDVRFAAHGWTLSASSVSVTGALHGAYLPSVPVEITRSPAEASLIGSATATTGTPHVVARLDGALFAVVLLPRSAIEIGRNRLWHVREDVAARLPPALCRLATRGRTGRMTLPPASQP